MPVRFVFFDIDGTLLSTGGAGQKAMEQTLISHFGLQVPFDGVLTAGRTDRGITDELFQRFGIENSPENREVFRQTYLCNLMKVLPDFAGTLLPGVQELLHHLSADSGLLLSLLTGNYTDGAWAKLRHFRIDHFFRCGGFGDDTPDRNDVARLALTAAASYSMRVVTGRDAVIIGDTPADVQCARAVGATAVAVATGAYSVDELAECRPDFLLEDFQDTQFVSSLICC